MFSNAQRNFDSSPLNPNKVSNIVFGTTNPKHKTKNNRKIKSQTLGKSAIKETKQSQKRELIKNSLEKRKEFEKLTLEWQEKLYDTVTIDVLQESAKFIQPVEYYEVIEERNADNMCGYPICPKSRQEIEGKYRISLSARKIYDVSELQCYCSDRCFLASKMFAAQLSEEAVYMRDFQSWKPLEIFSLDEDFRQVRPKSKKAISSLRSKTQMDYVKSLLGSLPPGPPELVIKEKTKDEIGLPMLPTSGQQNTHDSIEGFRIEFVKKKLVDPISKPTTLILSRETSLIDTSDTSKSEEYELAMSLANAMFRNGRFHYEDSENHKQLTKKNEFADTLVTQNNNNINQIEKGIQEIEFKTTISSTEKGKGSESSRCGSNMAAKSSIDFSDNNRVEGSPESGPLSLNMYTKSAKPKKTRRIIPKMSMFGKIWTALDRMTTQQTRQYMYILRSCQIQEVKTVLANQAVKNEIMNMRINIFSEKIIESYNFLRPHLGIPISIEDELLGLMRTFTLESSSVILNDLENNILCLVFVYALSMEIPRLRIHIFPSGSKNDDQRFKNTIESMGLTIEEMDAFVRVLRVAST